MEKITMSKMFQCLSAIAVMSATVVGSSHSADANNFPARGGKSDWPISEPSCWGLNGGTVFNVCKSLKYWFVPLANVGAGSFSVSVTAEAASSSSNVECHFNGSDRNGTIVFASGWFALPQFGVARDINLPAFVPFGGSGMVDCRALPDGKIHTVNW